MKKMNRGEDDCAIDIHTTQAARAFLNLFLYLKETNVCMSYNISYVSVMFWGYTDISLLSDFCVLNGWKRDDYNTLSWWIDSCSLWLCDFMRDAALAALSMAIAHCSIALEIHMNLKIL